MQTRFTKYAGSLISTFWPLLAALGLTGCLLALLGEPVFEAGRLLLQGSWGTSRDRCVVFAKSIPLILTGLAVAIPYRTGLFNIGGEGQMFVGSLCAAFAGAAMQGQLAPLGPLHAFFAIMAGCVGGALWAFIPAVLKTRRNVHEVLTTIIFNFLAFYIVNTLIQGPLSAGEGLSQTAPVAESARLPVLWQVRAQILSSGLLLSLFMAIAGSVYLHRFRWGRVSGLVGKNATACRYAGVRINRHYFVAMLLGGTAAGLGGALEVCGSNGLLQARFTPGYGFDGIAVAFLARAEPWACIPAALAIATLRTGGQLLQLELDLSKDIVSILEAFMITAVAIQLSFKNRKPVQVSEAKSMSPEEACP